MARVKADYTLQERKLTDKDGRTKSVFYYRTYRPDGTRTNAKSTGQTNRSAANAWCQKRLREGKLGNEEKPKTVGEFLEPYFDYDRCPHVRRVLSDKGRYAKSTASAQRSRIERYVIDDPISKKLVPTRTNLSEPNVLTAGDVEDWKGRMRDKKIVVAKLKDGTTKTREMGTRTINATLTDLKTALNEGVHRGELAMNPAGSVGSVKDEPEVRGHFTIDELKAMFASPDVWRPERESSNGIGFADALMSYCFGLTCFLTGERPSAIRQLRWSDLRKDELTFSTTKTGKPRTVPIVPRLVDALEELREDSVRIADEDFIFAYDDAGEPIGKYWFRNAFRRVATRLELPEHDQDGRRRTGYSLKVSFITHLIDNGADEMLVREYVGHSHTSGGSRVLTAVQSRYKARRGERLRDLLPAIEALLEEDV